MRRITTASIAVAVLGALLTSVSRPFVAHAATICPIGDCATSLTVAFAPLRGSGTPIPGGTGGFTSFPTRPAISNGNIVFTGAGVGQLTRVHRFADFCRLIESKELFSRGARR
jgi:hypothetical protein